MFKAPFLDLNFLHLFIGKLVSSKHGALLEIFANCIAFCCFPYCRVVHTLMKKLVAEERLY